MSSKTGRSAALEVQTASITGPELTIQYTRTDLGGLWGFNQWRH